MQFLCEATHTALPQPGHQRAACFANIYRQLSVIQCRYLSRMLMAAAGLHTARTGSRWIRGESQATREICTNDLLRVRPRSVKCPACRPVFFWFFLVLVLSLLPLHVAV
jgi:hypothetical protein